MRSLYNKRSPKASIGERMTPEERLDEIEKQRSNERSLSIANQDWLIARVKILTEVLEKITSCCLDCTICASCEASHALEGDE
jgi:hypothetical protein